MKRQVAVEIMEELTEAGHKELVLNLDPNGGGYNVVVLDDKGIPTCIPDFETWQRTKQNYIAPK